jgi:hypothetical protein
MQYPIKIHHLSQEHNQRVFSISYTHSSQTCFLIIIIIIIIYKKSCRRHAYCAYVTRGRI